MAKKGLSFRVIGIRDVLDGINASKEEVEKAAKDAVSITAFNIERKAKDAAPVRDGKGGGGLRAGILIEDHEEKGIVERTVGVRARYGPYVEWGTRTKVDVPAELRDYAIRWKVSTNNPPGSGMPARPYLFPAYFEERGKLVERIVNRLK